MPPPRPATLRQTPRHRPCVPVSRCPGRRMRRTGEGPRRGGNGQGTCQGETHAGLLGRLAWTASARRTRRGGTSGLPAGASQRVAGVPSGVRAGRGATRGMPVGRAGGPVAVQMGARAGLGTMLGGSARAEAASRSGAAPRHLRTGGGVRGGTVT